MAKRNVTKFLEESIETCWQGQRGIVDEASEEWKALSAKVEAYQEVYAYLKDGEEYAGGGSDVLDSDRPGLDEEEEKPRPDEDEEDDEQEPEEDE